MIPGLNSSADLIPSQEDSQHERAPLHMHDQPFLGSQNQFLGSQDLQLPSSQPLFDIGMSPPDLNLAFSFHQSQPSQSQLFPGPHPSQLLPPAFLTANNGMPMLPGFNFVAGEGFKPVHPSLLKSEHRTSRAARRGPMDEMRQLVRILVKLMPDSGQLLSASEGEGLGGGGK